MSCTCPNCGCEVAASAAPKRCPRPRLTDEERAQSRKETMARYYQRNKEKRREVHNDSCRKYYADHREDILEKLRASRHLAKEAKKAAAATEQPAQEAQNQSCPGGSEEAASWPEGPTPEGRLLRLNNPSPPATRW